MDPTSVADMRKKSQGLGAQQTAGRQEGQQEALKEEKGLLPGLQ